MLEQSDKDYIASYFSIYEHDWRFYCESLGEPFLVEKLLVYFDGVTLYICAFPLEGIGRTVLKTELESILNSHVCFGNAAVLDIWGCFETPCDSIDFGGRGFFPVHCPDSSPEFVASTVDLEAFSYASNKRARSSRNQVRNHGYTLKVSQRAHLQHAHIRLMEYWARTHSLSRTHLSMLAGVSSYIKNDLTWLIEVWDGGILRGFSLFGIVGPKVGIITQTFTYNVPGGRIGDALKVAEYDFAKSVDIRTLHLGYSATPSLRAFKEKWGAVHDGPPFREVFFSVAGEFEETIKQQAFLWPYRLMVTSGSSPQ